MSSLMARSEIGIVAVTSLPATSGKPSRSCRWRRSRPRRTNGCMEGNYHEPVYDVGEGSADAMATVQNSRVSGARWRRLRLVMSTEIVARCRSF